jgi:alpha-L-fucosidase
MTRSFPATTIRTTLIAFLMLAAVMVRSAAPVDMAKRTEELKSLRWGMFICWSISTFSGQEWRADVKDVAYFRAKDVDTDQWARTAKEAGMGYILFRTKDQDGFCLWDTKTTDRKVTKAPLGRDVLAELRKSCDKYGIKLALCFSQGEFRHHNDCHPGGGYTPEMQKAQLTELLTHYGPIEFVWFDHALGNGGLNHAQVSSFVKSLQPGCFVGFSGGDQNGADIRLDEETGEARPLADEQATGPSKNPAGASSYRLAAFTYPILPAHQGGAVWYYSLPKHDNLCHPAEKVYADYLDAVKYGNLFAINVGPDYNGKLRAIDVAALRAVGEMILNKAAAPLAVRKMARNQSGSEWRQDQFMILAWGDPTNDIQAAAYAKAKFNTVTPTPEHLDLCAKHGLRSLVQKATPEQAGRLKDHPAVWGWLVRDEPIRKEFVNVGQIVAVFHQADPNHPAYINLAGWENLDSYFRTVKPWFLSFDVYQWWNGGAKVPSTAAYCSELERHRIAALQAGVPLLCWVEANADWRYAQGVAGAGYLPDNAAKLRNSVWLALAHGVRGIQWFTGGLALDQHGNRTRSGEDVAVINHELDRLGPVLMTLRCEKVFHTEPLLRGTVAASPDFEFTSADRELTLGIFAGPDDVKHVIVVNREIKAGDTTEKRSVKVSFKQSFGVEQFNTATGKWEPVAVKKGEGQYSVSLNLSSGGGTLIRCRTR